MNNVYNNCEILTHIVVNNECILLYDYMNKTCYNFIFISFCVFCVIGCIIYTFMCLRIVRAGILPNDGVRPKIILLITARFYILIFEVYDINGYRGQMPIKIIVTLRLIGALIFLYALDEFIIATFLKRVAPYIYNRRWFKRLRQIFQTYYSSVTLSLAIIQPMFFEYYWQIEMIVIISLFFALGFFLFVGLITVYYIFCNARVSNDVAYLKQCNLQKLKANIKFSHHITIVGACLIFLCILNYLYVYFIIFDVLETKPTTNDEGVKQFHEKFAEKFSCETFILDQLETGLQIFTMLSTIIILKSPIKSMTPVYQHQRLQSFSFSQPPPHLRRPLTHEIPSMQASTMNNIEKHKKAFTIILTPIIRSVSRAVFCFDIISDILLTIILLQTNSPFGWVTLSFLLLPHIITACLLFPLFKRSQKNVIIAVILYIIGYFPFVIFIDLTFVVYFLFRSTNDYKRLVFYERIRFITETLFEAIPQIVVQFYLAFHSSVDIDIDMRFLYASIFGSILSIIRAIYIIGRGARLHKISVREYIRNLFKMGVVYLPYTDSLLRNTASNVSWDNLTPSELKKVLKLVQNCETCKSLNLANNCKAFETEEGFNVFLRFLQSDIKISHLYLSNNNLSHQQIISIIKAIRIHSNHGGKLTHLWLDGNDEILDNEILIDICDKLVKKNTSLKFLHLGVSTVLNREVFERFFEALKVNTNLQAVIFSQHVDSDCEKLLKDCEKLLKLNTVYNIREDVAEIATTTEELSSLS